MTRMMGDEDDEDLNVRGNIRPRGLLRLQCCNSGLKRCQLCLCSAHRSLPRPKWQASYFMARAAVGYTEAGRDSG
jgi:hypothetical protein